MFLKTVEDRNSCILYEINKELLELKQDQLLIQRNGVNLDNLKILISYIRQGSYKRIMRRLKIKAKNNRTSKYTYERKEYSTFPNKRVVIYTCIWGKYDELLEPYYINKNIDYFAITDQSIPEGSVWKKYDISDKFNLNEMSGIEINRACKMLPHKLFENYDYSIYVDGNVRLITDMMPVIADLGEKVLGIHDFQTDSVYEMKDIIVAAKKASSKAVVEQLVAYRNLGFPEHFGAFECNILVRNHMDEECIEIMEEWWKEFNKWSSKRDQLSLPYALWKLKKTSDFVSSLGPDVRLNPRFQVFAKHSK